MGESGELSREELLTLLNIAGELATQIDQDHPEHQGLYFAAAVGSKGPELMQKWGMQSNRRVPLESNAGQAFTSGLIHHATTVRQDESHYTGVDEQTRKRSKDIVSVPLRIGDRSIGVLQVLNKIGGGDDQATYDSHDCALLTHLGRLAATAINNASLVRKLTAQMGLYSRDLAEDLLERLDQPAGPRAPDSDVC